MGRRREARQLAREIERAERTIVIRAAVFIAAVVVSVLTSGLWADWFDNLIGLLGDGSTAAALVGWVAGFGVLIYGLFIVAVSRRWPDAFKRTWLIGVLLFIPFMTLQPSRTRRAASIRDEYWYLGSFFDTYQAGIFTAIAALLSGLLVGWVVTRGSSEDLARKERWFPITWWVATSVLAVGTVGTLIWALVGF
ncbi:MAG: hypothetical protein ABWX74_11615 [Aeromicrobium sp.]